MTADTLEDNIQWRAKQHDRKKKKMEAISEEKQKSLDGTCSGQLNYLLERAKQAKMELKSVSLERFTDFTPELIAKDSLTVILCSSALRCLSVIKVLKKNHENVAKLFAKHMKIPDQIKYIESKNCHVGVGTPQRVSSLAIKPTTLVIDFAFIDSKKKTIFDHPDLRADTLKCIEKFPEAVICLWDDYKLNK